MSGDRNEETGAILAPDSRTELARVTLRNVGIFGLDPDPAVSRFSAKLYVEAMQFDVRGL